MDFSGDDDAGSSDGGGDVGLATKSKFHFCFPFFGTYGVSEAIVEFAGVPVCLQSQKIPLRTEVSGGYNLKAFSLSKIPSLDEI